MTTLVLFGGYLACVVAIGLWAARKSRATEEDYFLGGRGMSALATALSAVSSGRSAWLILGASATAWKLGLSAVWLFPGYIAAEAWMFVSLGPRLRRRSAEVGAITIPEVFERLSLGPDGHVGTGGGTVRRVAGLVTLLFLVTYVSAQLVAGGKTLQSIFQVDGRTWGLAITAGIVLAYTLLGGYRAVVITDVVQALLMLGGMVVLPVLGLVSVGGPSGLADGLRAIDPGLLGWWGGSWLTVVGFLAIGLGSMGNPHILVRHMSLRDPAEARSAMWMGTAWNVVMAAGALLMGLVGRVVYPDASVFPEGDTEYLYATLAQDASTQYLFAGFVGVLLATLFAAVMSTSDSQLLVIASSLLRDFRRRSAGEASRGALASRLTVVAALAIALLLVIGEPPFVHAFVLLSWGALGASLGPGLLMLLYDARTTARGLTLGIVAGAVTVGAWYLWIEPGKSITYQLIPAYAVSLAAIWLLRAPRAPS